MDRELGCASPGWGAQKVDNGRSKRSYKDLSVKLSGAISLEPNRKACTTGSILVGGKAQEASHF